MPGRVDPAPWIDAAVEASDVRCPDPEVARAHARRDRRGARARGRASAACSSCTPTGLVPGLGGYAEAARAPRRAPGGGGHVDPGDQGRRVRRRLRARGASRARAAHDEILYEPDGAASSRPTQPRGRPRGRHDQRRAPRRARRDEADPDADEAAAHASTCDTREPVDAVARALRRVRGAGGRRRRRGRGRDGARRRVLREVRRRLPRTTCSRALARVPGADRA